MKSTQRGRARSRLAKGVLTENVIFSNGLGVCRLVPGAGQQSVCRRRTRDTTQPTPSLVVTQNIIGTAPDNALQAATTTIKILTNIIGATITVTATTADPVGALIAVTTPADQKSVLHNQNIVLDPLAGTGTTDTSFTNVKLTLTGGVLPTGLPHGTTSASLNNFIMAPVVILSIGGEINSNATPDNYFTTVAGAAAGTGSVPEITITSNKAGVINLVADSWTIIEWLSGGVPDDNMIVGTKTFQLNLTPDLAYGEQKIYVEDSSGNKSTEVVVTSNNTVLTPPALAAANKFVIDAVPPSAPLVTDPNGIAAGAGMEGPHFPLYIDAATMANVAPRRPTVIDQGDSGIVLSDGGGGFNTNACIAWNAGGGSTCTVEVSTVLAVADKLIFVHASAGPADVFAAGAVVVVYTQAGFIRCK